MIQNRFEQQTSSKTILGIHNVMLWTQDLEHVEIEVIF